MSFISKARTWIAKLKSSFFLVLVLIQVLLVVLSSLFTRIAIDIISKNENDKVKNITKYVLDQVDGAVERSLLSALGAANNKEILKTFASRDRQKLIETTAAYWKVLKSHGFKQFQFHLPPPELTTFLRVHEPETYGEELTSYRPTVVRCNLNRVIVEGLEQGRSGYGFRAVIPLNYEKDYIGSLEVGLDFGNSFLEMMDKTYPGKWGVYNLIRGVNAISDEILVAAINDKDGTYFKNILPGKEILDSMKNDQPYYEYVRDTESIALYIPVKNFLKDVAIFVKHVYPTAYYTKVKEIVLLSAIICVVGLILSGLIIVVLYRQITDPIKKLVYQTEKIKNFDLEGPVDIASPLKEIGDLIEAVKSMKIGLQSFQKYVPAQLVRQLIETNQVATVGGTRKNLTIFFSDVVNFTKISESLTPKELTGQLSEYLNMASEIIIDEGGTINQYLGDAIFAFWGAPLEHPDFVNAACRAALRFQTANKMLTDKWLKEGKQPFETRIGLNTGEIIVGNIGSATRLYYTAVGDAVNLASRLEALNKYYGTKILISEFVYEKCRADFEVRIIDYVVVKGRIKPVAIYELVAEKGNISSDDLAFNNLFNEAILLYKNRQWDEAVKIFASLMNIRPGDMLSEIFFARCQEFISFPPPADWDGTVEMKEK